MKKIFSVLFVLCLVLCSFAGCLQNNSDDNSQRQNKSTYISFTVTNAVAGSETLFDSHVFCYDLETRVLSEVGVVPYNAQYPLTAYDRSANMIYYSASALDGERQPTGDQLYALDLSTNIAKALTDELYAINYIIPTEQEIVLAACPLDASNITVQLFSWEKATEKLNRLSWDEDLNFSKVYWVPETDHLIGAGFSTMEFDFRLEHQDETPYLPPEPSLYEVDLHDKTHKTLFTLSSGGSLIGTEIQSVIGKGDTVIADIQEKKKDGYKETTVSGIYDYDSSGNRLGAHPFDKKRKEIEGLVYVSHDGQYLYYLGAGQAEDAANALYVYDTVQDKTDLIYESKKDHNIINNATVLSDY